MSQHDGNIADGLFPAVRTDLNNALAALFSNHSDSTAPTSPTQHQFWADTSEIGNSPSLVHFKYYDGTDWILLYTVNLTANSVTFNGTTAISLADAQAAALCF